MTKKTKSHPDSDAIEVGYVIKDQGEVASHAFIEEWLKSMVDVSDTSKNSPYPPLKTGARDNKENLLNLFSHQKCQLSEATFGLYGSMGLSSPRPSNLTDGLTELLEGRKTLKQRFFERQTSE